MEKLTVIKLQTGSRVLPYIMYPRDNDIAFIFLNKDEFEQASANRKLYKKQWKQQNIDGQMFLAEELKTTVRLGSYLFHFMSPIEGVEYPDIYKLHDGILIEINKWMQYLVDHLHDTKIMYHIYTNLAMWRNGNYQLTDDDISRINRFHMRCATGEDFDLLFQLLKQENQK